MFKPFLILSSLLSLSAPLAQAASLQQNLAAYGRTVLKQVSSGREIHLYHWSHLQSVLAGKDQSAPVSPTDNRVKAYLGYLRDQTFLMGNGTGIAGPGIYAAIDPMATCSYGGCMDPSSNGILVQFVLSPGVLFLDGLARQTYFPQELADQVHQTGCWASDLVSLFAAATLPACRNVRDQLIAVTGAGALRYSYNAASFQNCPARRPAAFVLFGDDAINWDRIVDFTAALPSWDDGHQENRLIIEALFATQGGGFYNSAPWPSLKGQAPRNTDLQGWMRGNLMGCGNWPEDL